MFHRLSRLRVMALGALPVRSMRAIRTICGLSRSCPSRRACSSRETSLRSAPSSTSSSTFNSTSRRTLAAACSRARTTAEAAAPCAVSTMSSGVARVAGTISETLPSSPSRPITGAMTRSHCASIPTTCVGGSAGLPEAVVRSQPATPENDPARAASIRARAGWLPPGTLEAVS